MRFVVLVLLASCGRLNFDPHGDGGGTGSGPPGDGSANDSQLVTDALGDGALTTTITYVGPFAQRHPGAGAQDSFTAMASAAGDVVTLQLSCASSVSAPSDVAVTATGWAFSALDAPQGMTPLYTAEYVAIAPDTNPATITVSWTGSTCEIGKSELGDEFAGVYTAGGVGQVYTGGAQTTGTGNCSATFTTIGNAETIWAACFSATAVSAVGPGYTKGADNGGGDWAEYRITTDPAGTVETASFTNSTQYALDVIGLRTN